MKTKRLVIFMLALVLLLPLFQAACVSNPSNTSTVQMAQEQKIVYNMGAEPPQLNSALSADAVSFAVLGHVCEGLTRRDQQDVAVAGMASGWDISDDNLTYTFHLRDATWSNGDRVTANDFAFAFKTLLDPGTAAPYAYFAYTIKNAAAYNAGELDASELGVRVIDEKTLEITLENPCPYFLDTLATAVMLPIKQDFYTEIGAENYGLEADMLIYNGPYEITGWEHSVSLTMAKRNDYWNADFINLTEIKGVVMTDAQSAYTSFLSGDLDMVNLVDANMIQDAVGNGVATEGYSDGSTVFLAANLANEALANQMIRESMAFAIDRQEFCDKILNDNSRPAFSFTSPAIRDAQGSGSFEATVLHIYSDGESELPSEHYNMGLSQLGVDSLELTLLVEDSDTAARHANAIAQKLKQNIGIDIVVEPMPFMSMLQRIFTQDYDLAYMSWGPDYNDPMTFLDLFETAGGNNLFGYSSEAYDALLENARSESDDTARYEIYAEMEALLVTELPAIPLYFGVRNYGVSNQLKGVHRSAFQDVNFLYAYLEA